MSKCRVFCAFHPQNKAAASKVMKDIISLCDCNVFYYDDGEGPSNELLLQDDLGEMALFVFIVSSDYLFTPCFARECAYDFALSRKIPVLPIMIENGLDEPFNQCMKNLQYILLNNEHFDITSVPYIEKLSNYLMSVITSSEDVKRLRKAFDTSIFLSYRKKDRRFAQELMKRIHDDKACRGVAIWYDEFLVPGEDFNEGIKSELEGSEAFILVVTPSVIEKNNYITVTEYPMAVSMQKNIIPFEMVSTDRDELTKAYPGLSVPFSGIDSNAVHTAIHGIIKQLGAKTLESSDEKSYLMGLAYLKGVYVEKNTDIGASMILQAAENGVEEAAQTAVSMYRTGEGVPLSTENAALWQNKIIASKEGIYRKNKNDGDAELLAKAYLELGKIYGQGADDKNTEKAYQKAIDFCSCGEISERAFAKEYKAMAYEALGTHRIKQGDYFKARYLSFEPALEIRSSQYADDNSLPLLLKMIELRAKMADCAENCQDMIGMKTEFLHMKKLIPDFSDISDPSYDILRRFLICNNRLGHYYIATDIWHDKQHEAFISIGNSVELAERLVNMSDCYDSRRQLMFSLINSGDQHSYIKVTNHLQHAERAYERALSVVQTVVENGESTVELKLDIARITVKLATVKKDLNRYSESVALFEKALNGLRELHGIFNSLPVQKELADCLQEAAAAYEKSGDSETFERLLDESIQLAKQASECSELAVYKKSFAKGLAMLADYYKKQWDADKAFEYRKQQCDLLRKVMYGTKVVLDMKLFASALKEAISVAKLAGEFTESKALSRELDELIEKNKMYFN